jgi:uncharacterized protein YmfQ (DUF2313 family)
MAAPSYSAADFVSAFQALAPRGRVWPRDADAVQTALLKGLAPTYEREVEAGNGLLVDAFPASTNQLLPEWEASLGLPDPCAGPGATPEDRRNQVVARFANSGGQSVAFFIAYAAALGYPITITQYASSRFGSYRFGQTRYGVLWDFFWQVNADLFDVGFATFGLSRFGDLFASWGHLVLECEFNTIKPAHTVVAFAYT